MFPYTIGAGDGGVYLKPEPIAAVYWLPFRAQANDALVGVTFKNGERWNLYWYGRDDAAAKKACEDLAVNLGLAVREPRPTLDKPEY